MALFWEVSYREKQQQNEGHDQAQNLTWPSRALRKNLRLTVPLLLMFFPKVIFLLQIIY
jgi:hypothetical protein